ncbi:MAG: FmdB family zinc ribbon protein [Candidatus Omnitrophota bacterium]|jgi:putative FmdB family regulatory protein
MPTYEYECTKCGNRFDVFQKMTDDPDAKCPKCKIKAKRLISGGTGIIFKGSGFYETDYKKKSSGRKSSGEAPSCSSTGCQGCPHK